MPNPNAVSPNSSSAQRTRPVESPISENQENSASGSWKKAIPRNSTEALETTSSSGNPFLVQSESKLVDAAEASGDPVTSTALSLTTYRRSGSEQEGTSRKELKSADACSSNEFSEPSRGSEGNMTPEKESVLTEKEVKTLIAVVESVPAVPQAAAMPQPIKAEVKTSRILVEKPPAVLQPVPIKQPAAMLQAVLEAEAVEEAATPVEEPAT